MCSNFSDSSFFSRPTCFSTTLIIFPVCVCHLFTSKISVRSLYGNSWIGMSFKWPWQYDFPPFFTLQKTLVTRDKQLEAWARLVVDYTQFHKVYTLDVNEVTNSELFSNTKLNRRLPPDGVKAVFEYLEQKKWVFFFVFL
ncbi:unnamed protein product [Caenorhabditis auriculariae]|uniref:Vacuolar protein-sorting-associated protein 25 n=1 Tax=Caenorhabditis auriculariae TaxID=2777116 RepID=A0A8S1HK43_9PELO|nr:unnamed protein product [Caenorhabditis auriculariae]